VTALTKIQSGSLPRLNPRFFEAFAVFAGSFLCILFFRAVGRQVSEFMRYPVSEGVITHIAVVVETNTQSEQCGGNTILATRLHSRRTRGGARKTGRREVNMIVTVSGTTIAVQSANSSK